MIIIVYYKYSIRAVEGQCYYHTSVLLFNFSSVTSIVSEQLRNNISISILVFCCCALPMLELSGLASNTLDEDLVKDFI